MAIHCIRSRSAALWASILAVALLGTALASCGDEETDDGPSGSGATGVGGGAGNGTPVPLDPTDYSYRLEQSTAELLLWTTPATHKTRTNERAPEATRSGLFLSAARREFEPAQLLVGPGAGTVTASIDPFPDLGAGQRLELAVASYEGGYAEHLAPSGSTASLVLSGDYAVPLWLTVRVPEQAPAGTHSTTLHLTRDGGATVDVPIELYVFDFELPAAISFESLLYMSIEARIPPSGSVDDAKTMLHEHRLTPSSVAWPSGYHWSITWENGASTSPCEIFWDEPTEGDEYSIGWLGPRYMLGEGWNGVGFPRSMLFQFVDNSTPRPESFCGLARGDHLGTPDYNAEWQQFLAALDSYLVTGGLADRTYYYIQNEPQDEADHALAAHLCRLTKQAAPHLRIAVSDEPKPEIAEDPGGACGYDLWIAHVRAYQEGYAWQRQHDFGEQVWLYSLDHDPDPYFNPTRVDVDGVHQRIIAWVSWRQRATGWAYYDADRFFDGHLPTIRAEILREGFEDWEYLALANVKAGGSAAPRALTDEPVDVTVRSVASGLTSWTRDPDALAALRHELGRYIEGSRDSLPVLESGGSGRPRAAYYLNFQDPAGAPTTDPLVIDGETYLKIGWQPYDTEQLLGWYGENVGNPSITLYGYDEVAGYDEAERSYVYDDYGRDNLFEFGLANGRYEVTVGAGRPAHGYPGDPHHVAIEGIAVIDDEVTTDEAPTIERTITVDLTDGSLSVVSGGRSETTGEWAYTFLAYLRIVPIE